MTTTSSEAARAALKAAIIEYQAQTPGLREGSITANLEARGFAILPIPQVGEEAVERAAIAHDAYSISPPATDPEALWRLHCEMWGDGWKAERLQAMRAAIVTLSPSPGAASIGIDIGREGGDETAALLRCECGRVHNVTEQFLAHVASPDGGVEWRGIESAPRDGTEVRLAEITTGHCGMLPGLCAMWETPDAWVRDEDFTHWRPLPAPPAEPVGEGG